MINEVNQFKKFAGELVTKAGKILLESQSKATIVKYKDLQDIATTADLASEKFIIDSIAKKYPDHSILSEEQGETDKKSDFEWIIDPLDGTKEFIRNIPMWNCSIALQFKGETIASATYRPYEDSLFSAGKDLGSFHNDQKIHVSKVEKLEEAFIYCYLPSNKRNIDKYDWAFEKLKIIGKKAYRLRALSDENSALCWMAQGGSEAYVNLANPPKIHDIAPGLLIAKEAGAFNAVNTIPLVVANNESIYNQLVDIIKI